MLETMQQLVGSPRLRQFSTAIGEIEGFFVTPEQAKSRGIPWPTVPQRLHNPGDLIYLRQHHSTPFTIVGKDGIKRTYCKFETDEDGWEACDFQVALYAGRGLSVQETINKWAPADDGNNPKSYTAGVCRILNCKPGDLLVTILYASSSTSPQTSTAAASQLPPKS
jgi:hypothetical protein